MGSTAPDLGAILSSLTLDEKISLLAGKNFWETVGIPEKGVPSLKVSDGPNGARGGTFHDGTTAACFPASVLLAASWDPALVRRVGNALGEETITKGAKVLLAPTVCPHRHPLGGRNFESFSEEPLLAGMLATEYILGVQEKGVGATIKHFAANEQETRRFTMNANISERALREIYLKPFEIAIKASKPWAVMTSYNLINGTHADMSEWLLQKVLQKQWGWSGLLMSDWGGTNSTAESINAGLDLEMPGPTVRRKIEDVRAAVESGNVKEATIDQRVKAILRLLEQSGKFAEPETPPEQAINKPEHQALIREAGGKGITLLKNENGILPLKSGKLGKVAVLGLAKQALAHGGGSAGVNAHYKVTPWDALTTALGDRAELVYAEGARVYNTLPILSEGLTDDAGAPGLTLSKWNDSTPFSSPPSGKSNLQKASIVSLEEKLSHITISGHYTPSETGNHYIQISGLGKTRLSINNEVVADITTDNPDSMGFLLGGNAGGLTTRHNFEAGQKYSIFLESHAPSPDSSDFQLLEGLLGANLGFMSEQEFTADVLSSAIDLAKTADLCLIFTGNTTAWETEGRDMLETNMRLPDKDHSQDKLIEGVAGVNKNVIVINSTGVAIETDPWLDNISAFVQTWFPGQEAGNAIVDVLTGKSNPGGKLPISWPKKLSDTPAYGNFPGDIETLQVNYAEDIFMGYRHFDKHQSGLLFPFGYGLSYTTFSISDIHLTPSTTLSSSPLTITAKVSNTGTVSGSEVLQIYISPSFKTKLPTPIKTLVSWEKIYLSPSENTTVEIPVGKEGFAYWDEKSQGWMVEKGEYEVIIATSSGKSDEVDRKCHKVEEEFTYGP